LKKELVSFLKRIKCFPEENEFQIPWSSKDGA